MPLLAPVQNPHYHQRFSTWSFETEEPLSLAVLREVAKKLPASIYRCKGVIYSTDAPTRRSVLQVVGKRVDLALEKEWGDRARRTQIVAIGAYGAVDGAVLQEKFETCIAREAPQNAVDVLGDRSRPGSTAPATTNDRKLL